MAKLEDTIASETDLSEEVLSKLESANPAGLTSQAILDSLDGTKFKISEATLRKWVQVGLLPRSVRVGRKGKHQGSQGVYPVSVIRLVKRIKEMMADDFTIEEIQREFLFARGDIEDAERTIERALGGLETAIADRAEGLAAKGLTRDLDEAREIARRLLESITSIESRLTRQARLRRHAV